LNQPYISVIVTAYNRRRYLPFALRSLEAQTLPRDKFEVIVRPRRFQGISLRS